MSLSNVIGPIEEIDFRTLTALRSSISYLSSQVSVNSLYSLPIKREKEMYKNILAKYLKREYK